MSESIPFISDLSTHYLSLYNLTLFAPVCITLLNSRHILWSRWEQNDFKGGKRDAASLWTLFRWCVCPPPPRRQHWLHLLMFFIMCLFYFCTNYFLIQTFLKRRCLCCLPWENTVIDTASLLASIIFRRLNDMEDVTQASLARPHQRNHTTAHCLSHFTPSSDQLSGNIKRLFWQQTWCVHIKKMQLNRRYYVSPPNSVFLERIQRNLQNPNKKLTFRLIFWGSVLFAVLFRELRGNTREKSKSSALNPWRPIKLKQVKSINRVKSCSNLPSKVFILTPAKHHQTHREINGPC